MKPGELQPGDRVIAPSIGSGVTVWTVVKERPSKTSNSGFMVTCVRPGRATPATYDPGVLARAPEVDDEATQKAWADGLARAPKLSPEQEAELGDNMHRMGEATTRAVDRMAIESLAQAAGLPPWQTVGVHERSLR